MSTVTWSDTDKCQGLVLDQTKLIASYNSGSTTVNVRSTMGINSGKKYFEITATYSYCTYSFVGISNKNYEIKLSNNLGHNDMDSIGYSYDGRVFFNGKSTSGYGVVPSGEVLGIGIDYSNKKMLLFNASGQIGECDISVIIDRSPDGYIYPSLSLNVGEYKANFGSTEFSLTVPTGFISYQDSNLMLIKKDDMYYTVTNDILEEVSIDDIKTVGSTLEQINQNINILPDSFEVVTLGDLSLGLSGLKTNTEMIVTNNDFPTTIHSNIDFFENQFEITNNGVVRIAFSIDEGMTWKTHNGTDFIDLPVIIPCKPYNELTEDELIQWDNAKNEILANGIDSATLKTLDFNTLTYDKIRFAYALHVDDVEDVALNKKLTWQFDTKGSMKLMKDDEINIEVLPTGIKVTPKVDSEMIKLNIITDDGQNGSSGGDEGGNTTNPTFNFATRQDILELF